MRIKRELATLLSKAEMLGSDIRTVADELSPKTANMTKAQDLSWEHFRDSLEKYPTKEEVTRLADEIVATTKRKQELQASLTDMGYEPKY